MFIETMFSRLIHSLTRSLMTLLRVNIETNDHTQRRCAVAISLMIEGKRCRDTFFSICFSIRIKRAWNDVSHVQGDNAVACRSV